MFHHPNHQADFLVGLQVKIGIRSEFEAFVGSCRFLQPMRQLVLLFTFLQARFQTFRACYFEN